MDVADITVVSVYGQNQGQKGSQKSDQPLQWTVATDKYPPPLHHPAPPWNVWSHYHPATR